MRTTLALNIGAIVALAGCGTGEQGAAPDEAAQAAIVEILDAAQTQADRVAEIAWYDAENLHKYINGMAPQFVDAGFILLAHTEWRDKEDEGPGYVELDLYDMGTPEGALAVFEEPEEGEAVALPGNISAYASAGTVEFCAERYYVRLIARRDVTSQERLLRALAEAVAEALSPPPSAPLPSSDPVMLVVSFYKVLLQKEAPTLQQEKELFGLSSPLRANLLARQKGTDTDPVVLQLFRQHRELFLPLGEMSPENYLSAIQISSPFNFVRSLKGIKEKSPAGSAYVMALFVHDAKAKPPRFRTVVFEIEGGKIAAGGIYLDGFRGQMTLEKFFEMVPVKE